MNENKMSTEIVTTLIALLGSVLSLSLSYWFSKKQERDAEWKKEKLAYYKAFVESLSGALRQHGSEEGQILFAKTSNNMLLFASPEVLKALTEFKEEIRIGIPIERHDALLKKLIVAMRADIGLVKDNELDTVRVGLWAPGPSNKR